MKHQPTINSFMINSEANENQALFYKLLHILFGLNFGFFDESKKQLAIKYISLMFCFTICVCNMIYSYYFALSEVTVHNLYYTIQQVVYVFILIRTKYTLYHYFLALTKIDAKLYSTSKTYSENFGFVTITVIVAFAKLCLEIVWSLYNHKTIAHIFVAYYFLWISHDFVMVTNSLVFFSMYRRLKSLSKQLETAGTGFFSYNNVYKSIVDATEAIKSSFDPIYFSVLLFNVPEIMHYIYDMVAMIRLHNFSGDSAKIILSTITVTVTLIETILPAVFAGLLTTQVEKMKIVLHNKLMKIEDTSNVKDVTKFIQYVDSRPMSFYVYQIIPLNADLLGMIFSFCVTYLIVIIQFTHLY